MTWPELVRLFNKMEEYPPIDVLAAAFIAKNKPKPIGDQIGSLNFPTKRGKVQKRGHISG